MHEHAVLKHTYTYVGRKQRQLITRQSVSQNFRAEKSDSEYKQNIQKHISQLGVTMNSIQCYLKKHSQVYLRLDFLQVDLLASGTSLFRPRLLKTNSTLSRLIGLNSF